MSGGYVLQSHIECGPKLLLLFSFLVLINCVVMNCIIISILFIFLLPFFIFISKYSLKHYSYYYNYNK